jgi:DNA-binding MarR family transcriptional regulator
MDKKQLWSLAEEAMRAFAPFYQATMRKAIQESGAPNTWFALSLAHGSDPTPFTVKRFQALAPYATRQRPMEALEELVQLELLERVSENAYRLTNQGRETVEGIFKVAHQGLATAEPLPPDEMEKLNNLLTRLVEATLEAPEPEEKWAMAYSRWTDPGQDAPESVKTDQYLTDLIRFRDDAHIAAWKPYHVSGQAWEALTFVWRGEAHTTEELVEKLPFRGHSAEAYAEALRDIAGRGWVEETSDGYQITEKGRALRQQAEEATDHYFFAPWACLSEAEKAQLHELLTQMRDNLQEMTAENAEETTEE